MSKTKTIMRGCVGCDSQNNCADAFSEVAAMCNSYDRTQIDVPVLEGEREAKRKMSGQKAFDAIIEALPNDDGQVPYWTDGTAICCEEELVAKSIAQFIDALCGQELAVIRNVQDKSDHYCITLTN